MTKSPVFLSYRRSDTAPEAGRIADALQDELGRSFVFRDIVSISPGDQFDAVLDRQLAGAELFLVLIGPDWLEELNGRMEREGQDFHRMEVATALKGERRVVPVLVRNADLPSADQLPEDLQSLAKCQSLTLRDEAWRDDIKRLVDAIGRPYRWDRLLLRAVAAVILIVLSVWKVAPAVWPERVSDFGFLRNLILGLVVAYGVAEWFVGYRYHKRLDRMRASTAGGGGSGREE